MIKLDTDYLEKMQARKTLSERKLAAVVLRWILDLQEGKGYRQEVLSWPDSEEARFWSERVLRWDIRVLQEFRNRWFREKYGFEYKDRHLRWNQRKLVCVNGKRVFLRVRKRGR